LAGAQFVEQANRVLASVAGEVAVMAIDHGQAGACSGRGRRWRCRHGARRWRRCVADRRSCAAARSPQRVVRVSSGGRGSCVGRGSRPARQGTGAGCLDLAADVRSRRARSPASAPPAGSPLSSCTSTDPL
jgi:hypothetical protein